MFSTHIYCKNADFETCGQQCFYNQERQYWNWLFNVYPWLLLTYLFFIGMWVTFTLVLLVNQWWFWYVPLMGEFSHRCHRQPDLINTKLRSSLLLFSDSSAGVTSIALPFCRLFIVQSARVRRITSQSHLVLIWTGIHHWQHGKKLDQTWIY